MDFNKYELEIINSALQDFENSLRYFDIASNEALALVIFINACSDTQSVQSTKFSALVHYPMARKSAWILHKLSDQGIDLYNAAIKSAASIIIQSGIVHPDLCS